MPSYPSFEGISAYCRGLSKEMNLLEPGSCPIITLRPKLKNLSGDEELLHYPYSSWNPLSLPSELLADLKNNVHELDGIVFHGPYHPKAAMLRRFLMKIGMPYIFVPHDPYVEELTKHHAFRKWVFWHLFEKETIRNAEVVQILAAEHEEPLRRFGFKVPVEKIPNGCELKSLSEVPKNAHIPGSAREVRIQYMGRMDRNHKGLDLLIEAFAEFSKEKKFNDVNLILTGNDWEDRGELQALAKRTGVEDRVIFTGPRPDEHSLKIHSEADLAVLPSRFDGFGLTIVEAMLAGRPVLVSKKTGVASHVEKAGGGWLCDPTIEGIRKGLVEAYESRSDWAKKGSMNSEYVSNHLTWKQTAEQTLAMYRRYLLGEIGDVEE